MSASEQVSAERGIGFSRGVDWAMVRRRAAQRAASGRAVEFCQSVSDLLGEWNL